MASGSPSPAAATLTCRLGPDRVTKPIRTCGTQGPWHKGKHPGLILARRLKRKAAQVWLFASRFDVPATNNGTVIRSPVRVHAACVSRPWCVQRRMRLTGLEFPLGASVEVGAGVSGLLT